LISYVGTDPVAGNFTVTNVPAGLSAGPVAVDTTHKLVTVTISLAAPPKADVWNGQTNGVSDGNWDTTTTNWISSNVPTNYSSADMVTFNDSLSGTANVNLTGTITPTSLTVTNNNTNYVFSGSGGISGPTGLLKQGSGTLLIDNIGVNNYSGGNLISAGVVQVGNNDASGGLPGVVTNNGTLIFDRSDNALVKASVISGGGTLVQNGGGTVTLSASNTYTGATVVNAGTLALNGSGSINSSTPVTVNNGTLDVSASSTAVSSSGSFSLTNGTLNLGTNLVTALGSLSLSNAALNLSITPGLPANIVMSALTTGGTTNVINITSLPPFPFYPTNITLITYTSGNNLVAGNTLKTLGLQLPPGIFAGYLTNIAGSPNSIQLVLLNGAPPIDSINWSGQTNGVNIASWDILTTSNWVTSDTMVPYYYEDGDAVAFNDNPPGSTSINLTANVQPASMTFNNSVSQYTLTGSGSIGGTNR